MNYLRNLRDYAETTSHAFLGEDRKGPYNIRHSQLQRTLAHGLGYATSPLRYGIDRATDLAVYATGGRRKGSVNQSSTTHKNDLNIMVKGKKIKKEVKKVVKKAMKARRPFRRINPATRGRFVGPTRPRRRVIMRNRRDKRLQEFTRVFPMPRSFGKISTMRAGFSWTAGSRPGCVTLRGKVLIGGIWMFTSVGSPTINSAAFNVADGFPTIGGASLITQWQVMPQNDSYFLNVLRIISQIFERYQIKTMLEFKSCLSTENSGAIKFAYFDDPSAFFAMTGKSGFVNSSGVPVTTDVPTTQDLSTAAIVREGNVWKDFRTPWTSIQAKDDYKYVTATTYTGFMDPAALDHADMVMPIQGTWVISGTGISNQSVPFKAGDVWCHFNLELCDMMNFALDSVIPSLRKVKVGGTGDRLARVEQMLDSLSVKEMKVRECKERKSSSLK